MEPQNSHTVDSQGTHDNPNITNHYDQYWKDVEKMAMLDNLPSIDINMFTEEHRGQMFHTAYDMWVSSFDPNRLVSELRSTVPSAQQRGELKHLRKYGLVLRSAYQMLDQRHVAPNKHWKLMKLLGEVNDAYFTPYKAETSERTAQFVEDAYQNSESMEFVPAMHDSFVTHYEINLERIKELSQEKTLSASDYHSMRKLLRNYMNLFRLSGMITHDPRTREICKYMQSLNDDLGVTQDNLTQQHLEGSLNYHTAQVCVPGDITKKIQAFINAHQPKSS